MPSGPTWVEAPAPASAPGAPQPGACPEAPGAVFVIDREGAIIDTSETMSGLTGFSFEELIGTRLELLLDSDGAGKFRAWFEGDRGAETAFEGVIKGRDEEFRAARFNLVPLTSEEGDRAGAVVRVDGRELEHSADSGTPAEARVLDLISDPGLLVDRRGKVVYLNLPARKFLGARPDDRVTDLWSRLSPEDEDRLTSAFTEALSGTRAQVSGIAMIRNDGRAATAEVFLAPSGPTDDVLNLLVILHPVQEQQTKIQELLDHLAQLTGEAFVIAGRDGRILVCDQRLASRLGYRGTGQLQDRAISDLVASNLLGAMTSGRGERLIRDTVVSIDTLGVTRQGSLAPIRLDVLAVAGDEQESHFICRIRFEPDPTEADPLTRGAGGKEEPHE